MSKIIVLASFHPKKDKVKEDDIVTLFDGKEML